MWITSKFLVCVKRHIWSGIESIKLISDGLWTFVSTKRKTGSPTSHLQTNTTIPITPTWIQDPGQTKFKWGTRPLASLALHRCPILPSRYGYTLENWRFIWNNSQSRSPKVSLNRHKEQTRCIHPQHAMQQLQLPNAPPVPSNPQGRDRESSRGSNQTAEVRDHPLYDQQHDDTSHQMRSHGVAGSWITGHQAPQHALHATLLRSLVYSDD